MPVQGVWRDAQGIAYDKAPISERGVDQVFLSPPPGGCLHITPGQLETSLVVQATSQIHVFHDGPILKSTYLKVRLPSNKDGLVTIGEPEAPGSQVGHEGDDL